MPTPMPIAIDHGTRGLLRGTIVTAAIAVLAIGCGPEPIDDEPEERIGHLELDYGTRAGWGDGTETGKWYREGKRIELFPEENPYLVHMCATLTDEAYDQIEHTIAALDPSVDYDLLPGETCGWSEGPGSRVHVEGFEHSPFTCGAMCCREELGWIASIYFLAGNELSEDPIEVHGQPFEVIDFGVPCE